MNVAEYVDWIRDVPAPSVQACVNFGAKISHIHSWYKTSLEYGVEFVVYLDPDVGGPRQYGSGH